MSLPRELSREDQWDLAVRFAERQFVERGMVADVCMHDKGDGNPHAHIMLTTRAVGEDGFGAKERSWNDRALLVSWREGWEHAQNDMLSLAAQREMRPWDVQLVDCRSYAAQGLDIEPQRHEGPYVRRIEEAERRACERDGREYEPVTDVARENAAIRERNSLREMVRDSLREIARRIEEAVLELRAAVSRRDDRIERDRDCAPRGIAGMAADAVAATRDRDEDARSFWRSPDRGDGGRGR